MPGWAFCPGRRWRADGCRANTSAIRCQPAQRGWANQLCEGGPQLFAALLAAGVVDELDCTFVPRLVGGDRLRISAGAGVDVRLDLAALFEQEGTILGRWLVTGQ